MVPAASRSGARTSWCRAASRSRARPMMSRARAQLDAIAMLDATSGRLKALTLRTYVRYNVIINAKIKTQRVHKHARAGRYPGRHGFFRGK